MKKILVVYTGGTIGMAMDLEANALKPLDFNNIEKEFPELNKFNFEIEVLAMANPIDSSDANIPFWQEVASLVANNYDKYFGFVILHGSDTMGHTASALSLMLQGIQKPVILTGSQLPIGIIRTDGKENFITSLEIASMEDGQGNPLVQEVAIYFEYTLLRGNRTFKYSAEHFDAFKSPNYPVLAEAGVNIRFNYDVLYRCLNACQFELKLEMDNNVLGIKFFPGMSAAMIQAQLNIPRLKGVVLETFGAGNMTTNPEVLQAIAAFIKNGGWVLNITQCPAGSVRQGMYDTSSKLNEIGVISGGDMTFEMAIIKMMFVLKNGTKSDLNKNLVGEISLVH